MDKKTHRTVTATLGGAPYTTTLEMAGHTALADEPTDVGGANAGPRPHDLLCASLAACTAITLRMYADRKQWPSGNIAVTVELDRTAASGTVDSQFLIHVSLDPALTEEQRTRMLQIAAMCPVHKTLTNPISIKATLT